MRRLFPALRICVRPLNDAVVFVDPADKSQITIFDEIALERSYDLRLVTFEPTHIIDCGGHVGMFTAMAGKRFRGVSITTFEPMAANAAVIDRVRNANRLKGETIEAAVSTMAGVSTFHVRNSCGGSLTSDGEPVAQTVSVAVIDFVDWVRQITPDRLLLKMDIEGEEERLVPPLLAVLPKQCAIFFETHRGETGWTIVADALRDAGFNVRCTRKRDPFRDGFALRSNV